MGRNRRRTWAAGMQVPENVNKGMYRQPTSKRGSPQINILMRKLERHFTLSALPRSVAKFQSPPTMT